MFWEVLLDVSKDMLKTLPILYLVYLLVCFLGHNTNNKYAKLMNQTKRFGPLIGAVTGCIPQCGFSAVMADLYSRRAVTIGTLIAVMLATSDEAIPIMIAHPDKIVPMLIMIGIKLLVAIVFGYLFDLIFKLFKKEQVVDASAFSKVHNHDCELTACSPVHIIHDHYEDVHGKDEALKNQEELCEVKESKEHHHHSCCCGGTIHEHGDCVDNIFLDALLHTSKIFIFLFIASLIISLIVHYAGIENLSKMFTSNIYVAPFIAALIGLIPSCASSVFLVEFYIAGGITFGALMAGLCAGSGIGIFVLFTRNRKHILSNILIVVSLYIIGSLIGLLCTLIF